MDENEKIVVKGNFKNKQTQGESVENKYEKTVNEFRALLSDKTHPNNRTDAYKKNVNSILNRLCLSADELDEKVPGQGIFGLLVVSLTTALALKDKNLELEVELNNLKKQVKKLEKRSS